MIRRMFLKLFSGGAAACAVAAAPKIVEAAKKAREKPITEWPALFADKALPRRIEGYALTMDQLCALGLPMNPRRGDLLRMDAVIRSAGVAPSDAALEMVYPVMEQDILVFMYRHPTFDQINDSMCISLRVADYAKISRFYKKEHRT